MKLAVLINSCDKFADCWEPFFTLWKKFGPKESDCTLYLVTERAEFGMEGMDIRCCKVCERGHWQGKGFPTWSWCTLRALEQVEEEVVLYMQEDYFLTHPVNEAQLRELVLTLHQNPAMQNIHVTDYAMKRRLTSPIGGVDSVDPADSALASLQGALWRKEALTALLREAESAWDFEYWAMQRARLLQLPFYIAQPQNGTMPLRYVLTGVIQGKWFRGVIPVFAEHGMTVDYSRRGFYDGPFGKKEGRFLAWWVTRLRLIWQSHLRFISPFTSWAECLRLRIFGK